MSIRFSSLSTYYAVRRLFTATPTGEYYPPFPSTVAFWIRLTSDRNAYSAFAAYGNGGKWFIGTNATGTNLVFYNGTNNNGSNLTVGQWYHVAIVSHPGATGARRLVYLDGKLDINATGDEPTTGGNAFNIGSDTASEYVDGCMSAFKVWAALLTPEEIKEEMRYNAPVRKNNLWAWWPMVSTNDNYTDRSGQGHPLELGSTVQGVEDDPPIAWAPSLRLRQGVRAFVASPASGIRSQVIIFG